MRNVPANFQTKIDGPLAYLATCWHITRQDGVVLGFTDHDEDLSFNGVTYESQTGISPTDLETNYDLSVDNMDVTTILDSSAITEEDLRAGKFDAASLQIFLLTWDDVTSGAVILKAGVLGDVSYQRGQAQTEVRGLSQYVQQTTGRLFLVECDADLGDSRCRVNLTGYTVNGTVTAVTSRKQFDDTSRTEADGHFNYGLLTWTSGENNGGKMEVKIFRGGMFNLFQSMAYNIAIGDTYTVYAGCNHSLDECKNKFNNVVNFQGFPHIPGNNELGKFGGQ